MTFSFGQVLVLTAMAFIAGLEVSLIATFGVIDQHRKAGKGGR